MCVYVSMSAHIFVHASRVHTLHLSPHIHTVHVHVEYIDKSEFCIANMTETVHALSIVLLRKCTSDNVEIAERQKQEAR